ncbi:Arm DNA-binding domain-containing protein, partial [Paracidovorax cattleyae]
MLTDAALRNLKPKAKPYKASDRDGLYVTVLPSGTVTFRYDYRLNGRRETLTLGRYGAGGISLAMARELLLEARKSVQAGISPAIEKQRAKRRVTAIKTFGAAMDAWLANARLVDDFSRECVDIAVDHGMGVSAEVKLTHCAEVKVTHLG